MNCPKPRYQFDTQVCIVCNQELPVSRFEWPANRPNPRKACSTCRHRVRFVPEDQRVRRRLKQKEWYQANKERARDIQLRVKYGITTAEFDALLEQQNHRCPICQTTLADKPTKQVHVDHCHKTGRVRGILCGPCNSAIGLLREDVLAMKRAIRYVLAGPHYEME